MNVGLVHGAWHGAWCFDHLVAELRARGHDATAVQLPCDDLEAGGTRYAEIVDAALPPDPALVLVGHSLGGLTVPLVSARRPVGRLVYLCALIPEPGRSLVDQLRDDPAIFSPGFGAHPACHRDEEGRSWWEPEAAADVFYHDCPPERATAAVARLRRQAPAPSREPCPLARLPPTPASYILCRQDAAIAPAWSRGAARTRLGVDPIELDGGHSPFLARPAELADVLASLAP